MVAGGVHGCQGEWHAWLLGWGVHGFRGGVCGWGACMVVGACIFFWGGAWLPGGMHGGGGYAWLMGGHMWLGACVVVGGMHGWGACVVGGACMAGGCMVVGGVHRIRPDMVNEWVVCILLECILVKVVDTCRYNILLY